MLRVLIAVIGNTGNEAEALRQILESFGCLVLTKYIGRPNDLISVLSGTIPFDPEMVILSCHGEKGEIVMPTLGETVYTEDEPREDFGAAEVGQYLQLTDKTIINLGCTTGLPDLTSVFAAENRYIAPIDYIDSNAALLFVIHFFYQIIQNRSTVENAWRYAHSLDSETARFSFFSSAV